MEASLSAMSPTVVEHLAVNEAGWTAQTLGLVEQVSFHALGPSIPLNGTVFLSGTTPPWQSARLELERCNVPRDVSLWLMAFNDCVNFSRLGPARQGRPERTSSSSIDCCMRVPCS